MENIKTIALTGLEGNLIEVQTDITGGIPTFDIVGLPDMSVKESKERIRSAIKNSGIEFPSRKILINLAPADTRKEGTSYDLPIAIGILAQLDVIKTESIENTIFIGELSLDGKINHINGVLPMCIEALNLGIKRVILPRANEREAVVVKDLEIVGARDLKELIYYLNGEVEIQKINLDIKNIFKQNSKEIFDFSEVKGQENVKRALEISAAGNHNCLLIGSPRNRKNDVGKAITVHFTRFNI